MCRAMAAAGVVQDDHGVARLSPAQKKRYDSELDRIFADEGRPDGAPSGEPRMTDLYALSGMNLVVSPSQA